MVPIKHTALWKTSVGFGEGENGGFKLNQQTQTWISRDCTASGEEEIVFYYCTWQYLV